MHQLVAEKSPALYDVCGLRSNCFGASFISIFYPHPYFRAITKRETLKCYAQALMFVLGIRYLCASYTK